MIPSDKVQGKEEFQSPLGSVCSPFMGPFSFVHWYIADIFTVPVSDIPCHPRGFREGSAGSRLHRTQLLSNISFSNPCRHVPERTSMFLAYNYGQRPNLVL